VKEGAKVRGEKRLEVQQSEERGTDDRKEREHGRNATELKKRTFLSKGTRWRKGTNCSIISGQELKIKLLKNLWEEKEM